MNAPGRLKCNKSGLVLISAYRPSNCVGGRTCQHETIGCSSIYFRRHLPDGGVRSLSGRTAAEAPKPKDDRSILPIEDETISRTEILFANILFTIAGRQIRSSYIAKTSHLAKISWYRKLVSQQPFGPYYIIIFISYENVLFLRQPWHLS